MRRGFLSGLVIVILTLLSRVAIAGPDKTTPAQHSKEQIRSTRSSAGLDAKSAADTSDAVDAALAFEERSGASGWRGLSVSLGMESHAAVVLTDMNDSRSRPRKLYNFFFLSPQMFLTARDLLRADLGFYQYSMSDPEETGARLTDFGLSYTRYIPIATEKGIGPHVPPLKGVLLRAQATLTAPTSYTSHLRGIITVPRLRLFAERAFLSRTLIVSLNTLGEVYFARYRTAEGGAPNAKGRYALEAAVDYFMPFHRQLSVGLAIASDWVWFYDVDTATALPYGVMADPTFKSQPVQQGYSGEVEVRYSLPTFYNVHSTVAVAYSMGDNALLHDGVRHFYFGFWRRASEFYGTLSFRF